MDKKKADICHNCGEEINGKNYCHNCGQPNKEKIISMRSILGDFFSEYFTFDSKFFKSLFPLLFKPGKLTKEYVDGKRVSYILPLRLYLFTTFIFFFVLALGAKLDSSAQLKNNNKEKPTISRDSLETLLNNDNGVLSPEMKDMIMTNYDAALENDTAKIKTKGLKLKLVEQDISNFFKRYMQEKYNKVAGLGEGGTQIFIKEMINQIPKVLFFLLPVFALILKLLYVRHKRLYIEHLVFSLHFHTFVFIILMIPVIFTQWWAFAIAFFTINIYLYFSLHNYYEDTYIKAFFKWLFICFGYLFALVPALLLLVLFAVVSI